MPLISPLMLVPQYSQVSICKFSCSHADNMAEFIGLFCCQDMGINELSHEGSLQHFYMESLRDGFVGRKALLKQCTATVESRNSGLLVVTGKHGSGKSSLMVHFISC